jgi:hypothetical protein
MTISFLESAKEKISLAKLIKLLERSDVDIKVVNLRTHMKASEAYVDVEFKWGRQSWKGSVPIWNRRANLELSSEAEIVDYLIDVRKEMTPGNREAWLLAQKVFWNSKPRASVTRPFFDALTTFDWTCASHELPQNANYARRIQDIKDFGFCLATDPSRRCERCEKNTHQLMLLPISRGEGSRYEVWSSSLRKRIIKVLKSYDAFEGRVAPASNLLPDHKFPTQRWDSTTSRPSLENLSDTEIVRDFQLLSNQRNQQKREICRACFQTGIRPKLLGISFFYAGNQNWPEGTPKTGKQAEKGCQGCPWYDMERWRNDLQQRLRKK